MFVYLLYEKNIWQTCAKYLFQHLANVCQTYVIHYIQMFEKYLSQTLGKHLGKNCRTLELTFGWYNIYIYIYCLKHLTNVKPNLLCNNMVWKYGVESHTEPNKPKTITILYQSLIHLPHLHLFTLHLKVWLALPLTITNFAIFLHSDTMMILA